MAFDLNGLFKSTTSQFCDFCRLPVTLEGPASHMSLGLDCWRRPSVTTTVTKHRTNVPFCQPSGLFYLFFNHSSCHDIEIFLHFRPIPCSVTPRKTCVSVILSQYWFPNGQKACFCTKNCRKHLGRGEGGHKKFLGGKRGGL